MKAASVTTSCVTTTITNCAVLSGPTTCIRCNKGFVLSVDAAVANAGNLICIPCATGCLDCRADIYKFIQ